MDSWLGGWSIALVLCLLCGCAGLGPASPDQADPHEQGKAGAGTNGVGPGAVAGSPVAVGGGLHLEPVLAIDPADADHLVVATKNYDGQAYRIATSVSRDGGRAWTPGAVDLSGVPEYPLAFVNGLAFAPDGSLGLVARLEGLLLGGVQPGPALTVFLSSHDGGASFGDAHVVAPGSLAFNDDVEPPLAVSPDDGALHTALTQTREDGVGPAYTSVAQALVATSRDAGQTWSFAPLLPSQVDPVVEPAGIGTGFFIGDFQLATLPGGVVHATWVVRPQWEGVDPVIWTASSQDGGRTFALGRQVATITHGDCPMAQGLGPAVCAWTTFQKPALAVRADGAMAVAFTTYDDGQACPVVMRSTDGGATWSDAVDLAPRDGVNRSVPRLAFDSAGRLHSVMYESTTVPDGEVTAPILQLAHAVEDGAGFRVEAFSQPYRERDSDDLVVAYRGDGGLAAGGAGLAMAWMQESGVRYSLLAPAAAAQAVVPATP